MRLRQILHTEILPRRLRPRPGRQYAWPLLALTAPMYAVLFGMVHPLRTGRIGLNWHVYGFCAFLARTPVVWTLAAVWFLIDVYLVVQTERALGGGGEPARPTKLFFLWQCAKIAFFFLFFAVLIAHGPLSLHFPEPDFDLP